MDEKMAAHRLVVHSVRHNFGRREADDIAFLLQFVSHFHPSHQTGVKKDGIEVHREFFRHQANPHLIDFVPAL